MDLPAVRLLGRRAECEFLDAALADARAGRSRVVVLRGEAGAGKSVLLDSTVERAEGWRVATAVGIESEMELAYSGLHELCAPMLDHVDRLPIPQRDALRIVVGQQAGAAPDRFLVGLATLTLLAEVAEHQPLSCVIDDAHWLDTASAQIVQFVGRRLLAERIALVCAARAHIEVLVRLPDLPAAGLRAADARSLLLDNLKAPFHAAVCEQIVAESHGNPLALLELPRTWDVPSWPAGSVSLRAIRSPPRSSRATPSDSWGSPPKKQLLVLVAAAEPLGDPLLLQRSVEILDLDVTAAGPAVDASLLDIGARIGFAHPLVRSAAYRSAAGEDRHRVHRALAAATDPERHADRHAWHLARAAFGPERRWPPSSSASAERAQARGGIAAAAAFLERAAALSPDAATRARRSLAAGEAKQLAGAPHAAATLVVAAAVGPLDPLDSALACRLQGQIALEVQRGREAVPLLLDAAHRLETLDPGLARATYLMTLRAGSHAGRLAPDLLRRAAVAAQHTTGGVGGLDEGEPLAGDGVLDGLSWADHAAHYQPPLVDRL